MALFLRNVVLRYFSILFLLFPSSFASGRLSAQHIIRSFNLFPAAAANIRHTSPSTAAYPLVEWPFRSGLQNFNQSADLAHRAGYYSLPHSLGARMFYLFFESRSGDKNAPVVIWLTGGPGCSSELALFYENGPFHISGNNLSLTWNDFGWDKVSNLLYVDQPTGTGFSYTSDERDIRHNEEGVSNDLYDFIQAFFTAHPQFVKNEFYITGESYAGHYIPAFAARVHKANKEYMGLHINLKGFAIGNGLTDPAIQYRAYVDYAMDMRLISRSDHKRISDQIPPCENAVRLCDGEGEEACLSSYTICQGIVEDILSRSLGINYYDVRRKCEGELCYDFSNMERYLEQESVREVLGVGDIGFVSCSAKVYEAMLTDWMRDLELGIPSLLEDGIKMLVYAGEYDFICNWLGNYRWVEAMEWSGQNGFRSSPFAEFAVKGKEAGWLKNHGVVTFVKVKDAGHLVPMDQPEAALDMLQRWIQDRLVAAEVHHMVAPMLNSPDTSFIRIDVLGHQLQFSQNPNSLHSGTTVWDASIVFIKFIEKNSRKGKFCPSKLKGKRVIELGAGCGVAGIAMAMLGCDVVSTDQREVLPLLKRNIDLNTAMILHMNSDSDSFGSIQAKHLDWGNSDHIKSAEPPFDYIIGTDIVYAENLLDPLLHTILGLAAPSTTVVLGYEMRSTSLHEVMLGKLRSHFEVNTVSCSKMDARYQHPSIYLFTMRPKKSENGKGENDDDFVDAAPMTSRDSLGSNTIDWEARRSGSMAARLLSDVQIP